LLFLPGSNMVQTLWPFFQCLCIELIFFVVDYHKDGSGVFLYQLRG
jgi:hypothetical protein